MPKKPQKETCAKYHRKQPPSPKNMVESVNLLFRRRADGQNDNNICPVCEYRIWSEYWKGK